MNAKEKYLDDVEYEGIEQATLQYVNADKVDTVDPVLGSAIRAYQEAFDRLWALIDAERQKGVSHE